MERWRAAHHILLYLLLSLDCAGRDLWRCYFKNIDELMNRVRSKLAAAIGEECIDGAVT